MGIHDHPVFKLGKAKYEHDPKTIMFDDLFLDERKAPIPTAYAIDRALKFPFPIHKWGNDQFGDCVIASRCNGMLRMEFGESGKLAGLTDENAIKEYKKMTGCVSPGDANDMGLVMIDAMKEWQQKGMTVHGFRGKMKVAAYGEISNANIKRGIATLGNAGVHLGFSLPRTAQAQVDTGVWDYVDSVGNEPGSWGGHAVWSGEYDNTGVYIITWGRKVRCTPSFISHYCDERWGVVDNPDKVSGAIDISALEAALAAIK